MIENSTAERSPFQAEEHRLQSFSKLKGCSLHAKDGSLGQVHDLLFDDLGWTVRYIVADTGGWLPGRKVLLSPESFGKPDWEQQILPVDLTRGQIEASPPISEDRPVSRELEIAVRDHYRWLPYWTSPRTLPDTMRKRISQHGDPNLRSCAEVIGYRLQAEDSSTGSVSDLLVGGMSWCVRYLVVEVKVGLLDKKDVLVPPSWIDRTSWHEKAFHVSIPARRILDSPEFEPPIDREFELALLAHYSGSGTTWQRTPLSS